MSAEISSNKEKNIKNKRKIKKTIDKQLIICYNAVTSGRGFFFCANKISVGGRYSA